MVRGGSPAVTISDDGPCRVGDQSEVTMTDMMTAETKRTRPEDNWQHYDFRRPNKLTRDQVRSLDLLHDGFCRRLAAGLGAAVRGNATAEIVHTTGLLRTLVEDALS